jgi:hypothetical protein
MNSLKPPGVKGSLTWLPRFGTQIKSCSRSLEYRIGYFAIAVV